MSTQWNRLSIRIHTPPMRLKILGCGTSTGVPIPGCKCQVCRSTDPKNHRDRTSALIITDSGEQYLIDATPDLRHQALRWQVDFLDAVLFTHAHADHIFGIDDLRSFNFTSGKPLPCYATETTFKSIRQTFSYLFDRDPEYKGGALADLDFQRISAGDDFNLGKLTIEPFELRHGKMEVLGFKMGNLAYATDCHLIPENSKQALKGIDILILDGLRYQSHPTHLSIPEAIALAQELKVGQTYLTHMTHTVDYQSVSSQLPKTVELAYDGLEIEFEA